MLLLALAFACSDSPSDDESPSDSDPSADDTGSDDTGSDDTGSDDTGPSPAGFEREELAEPVLTVDVLVVGGGPAGLMAAYTAQEMGSSVLVLEMAEHAGGGGHYAANFFGAGTVLQAELGVVDSPEQALEDWAEITGGDADDPLVQAFVHDSADLLDWMVVTLGVDIPSVDEDPGAGETPRIHAVLDVEHKAPVVPLIEALGDQIWTFSRGEGLVRDGDAAVGVRYQDLQTGEYAWIEAGAVVVATGGFARDAEKVAADRPELPEGLLFETHRSLTRHGARMLDWAGASLHNAGHQGVYAHSVEDPRPGFELEALWIAGVPGSLIVDLDGQRFMDEDETRAFRASYEVAARPEGRAFSLIPRGVYELSNVLVPAYNHGDTGVDHLQPFDLIDYGVVVSSVDPAEIADHFGIDADALALTIERYNELAYSAEDEDFGKSHNRMLPLDDTIYGLELRLGSAKSFGGVALDLDCGVVQSDGESIPGLYAAGEVAGMLGTEAVGIGLSGSISMVYWTGRCAGASASEHASAG